MKTAFSRVMLAALLGASTVALAGGTADEPAKRTVHFADLNLAQAAGAAVLYQRIRAAARDVCAPVIVSDLAALPGAHACIDQAIARAVTDVNAPMLTSYYQQQTHRPVLVARR